VSVGINPFCFSISSSDVVHVNKTNNNSNNNNNNKKQAVFSGGAAHLLFVSFVSWSIGSSMFRTDLARWCVSFN
jgi:hypothetical protein